MATSDAKSGTTALSASLNILNGKGIGECMATRRRREFIPFLKKADLNTPSGLDLHFTADNYTTHKHPSVKRWLPHHPHFHAHFTPISSSWVNVVERWFRNLTDKRL
jgi:hypothetical protein